MSQGNARWGIGATGAAGAPGATGPAGPAGPPGAGASGAALFELAPVASPRFIGRFSAGSGVMQELTPAQGASLIPPFFASGSRGVVLGPTGGVTGNFLRDDGTWAAAGAAGRPSGVTLGEQEVAPPLTVQGRFTLGTGTREDLSPGSVASLIGGGWGSGMQLLKAPTGGVQGRVLRDDGQWVQPSFVASGIALGQLGALSPLRVVGRFTAGSGTPEQLSGDQVASMIGRFGGSGYGLVPTPTGGVVRAFYRDDGSWQLPLASGIANAALGAMLAPSVKGRFTLGSGVPEDLSGAQVASMLPKFSATVDGIVPRPTGAGSGMFLRDDGTWGSPTGLGNGQFAFMPPGTIKGTPGATGVPQDLVGSAVATLLPLFNNIDKGLVPGSGGGTANFLRADGQWAGPSVAAGVSGVAFAQLQDISAPRFVGRFQGSGSMQELSPLTAASMLPRMLGSGFGLVVAPTGGTTGAFLRDDGSFQPVNSSGGGPTMLAAGPQGAVQYNGGSGFAGATGFRFDAASGVYLGLPLLMPSGGFIGFGGSGANGPPVGTGLIRFPFASRVMVGAGTSGADVALMRWGDGGAPQRITWGGFEVGRFSEQGQFFTRQTGNGGIADPNANLETLSGSGYSLLLGNQQALRAGPEGHQWGASGVQVAALDANAFSLQRLGIQGLAHSGMTDKLGAVTASGFSNTATGIQILASGAAILVGPTGGNGPLITASGFSFAGAYGVGNAQAANMPPVTIKGRFTFGSGAPEDLSPAQVASLLPPFFASGLRGVVISPTGGTSGKYLQDDGSWTTPSAGGATGVANGQMIMMPPFTFKGRQTIGSGVPEDLTNRQAASMLPLFTASGSTPGLVTAPTGGASGYFLRDDGTFQNLVPRVERLVGPVGSGTIVGSATIDFTLDPYQNVELFGNTQFKITPPTLHRHTQLRLTVRASGITPTFYGTAVKWAGGSGSQPSWSTGSGIVNFANFFYDGSVMWGQGGVGFG